MKSFGTKTLLTTCWKIENFALKILGENSSRGQIYIPSKSTRWQSGKGQNCPSGRSGGRPANGHIYDRWATGRPADRPETGNREQSSMSVDRTISREQKLSGGRPTRSTGLPTWATYTSVHVGRPDRSTDFCLGRPVRSTSRQPCLNFRDWKLIFLPLIKSHKIT